MAKHQAKSAHKRKPQLPPPPALSPARSPSTTRASRPKHCVAAFERAAAQPSLTRRTPPCASPASCKFVQVRPLTRAGNRQGGPATTLGRRGRERRTDLTGVAGRLQRRRTTIRGLGLCTPARRLVDDELGEKNPSPAHRRLRWQRVPRQPAPAFNVPAYAFGPHSPGARSSGGGLSRQPQPMIVVALPAMTRAPRPHSVGHGKYSRGGPARSAGGGKRPLPRWQSAIRLP